MPACSRITVPSNLPKERTSRRNGLSHRSPAKLVSSASLAKGLSTFQNNSCMFTFLNLRLGNGPESIAANMDAL